MHRSEEPAQDGELDVGPAPDLYTDSPAWLYVINSEILQTTTSSRTIARNRKIRILLQLLENERRTFVTTFHREIVLASSPRNEGTDSLPEG